MRRTILLLATMALALLLVGGVAASKQRQEQSTASQSPTTTTDKSSSGDVTIQSTAVKASFTNGSGVNFLHVAVSDHGNLTSFESPASQEAVFAGSEGYVVCTGGGATVHGHDTGSVEAGFGTPTFAQPNGAGTFPLTVTRNTTGGAFQLKQVWAKPDAIEKDVTLTMTLKNISGATLSGVELTRTGDFDVGSYPRNSVDRGATTLDSTWLWDDQDSFDSPAVGLMLTALTFGTLHDTSVEPHSYWAGATSDPTRDNCYGVSPNTPLAPDDYALRMIYHLGNMSAGQSKTVKIGYGRM